MKSFKAIDTHPALDLLKSCFAILKFQYVLRTWPSCNSLMILYSEQFNFDADNWELGTLPVRYGGRQT